MKCDYDTFPDFFLFKTVALYLIVGIIDGSKITNGRPTTSFSNNRKKMPGYEIQKFQD